ncbi:vitellogenin-like [Heptranchias perlo]|uniref:vitellogenin-like n=1 Tax=Heptranchias perlo TaxID=212740 RepID=UPI0035594134
MRAIIFLLALAFAQSEHDKRYEPSFSEGKMYIYKYEAVVQTGMPERSMNRAGVKISSKVTIKSVGQMQYILQVENPQIQELNGISQNDQFSTARKLTERLAPQLTKPVKFEYNRGRVGSIRAPANLPEDALNILRGILNAFQITIKKSQNFYDLQEAGIEGICHARYIIQEDRKTNRVTVTKAKDLTNCQNKVEKRTGMGYSQSCPSCQQRGRNIRATATYTYVLKPTAVGAIVQRATVREVHQFTPFHELDGVIKLEARQLLILQQVTTASLSAVPDLQNRGDLQYHSDRSILEQPLRLMKDQNVITQIKDILNHMAQHNVQDIHADAPSKFLQLVQLLRLAQYKVISDIWRQVERQPEQRHWILEALPAVATINSLRLIKTIIEDNLIGRVRTIQVLVLALHQVNADRQVLSLAKDILDLKQVKQCQFLRKATYLAYGSLVFKQCADKSICPDDILKPLHDLLAEASSRPNNEDIVLGLKAIGNAGQPASIKAITKMIPGFGTAASQISLKVRVDAIMALINIAKKDPRTIQRITMQIFFNKRNQPEERMMACEVLFATKPPLTLIAAVANSLLQETSLQVASFTYKYLKTLSRSPLPSLNSLAAASNLVLNFLNLKLDQLGYRFSKVYSMDAFRYQMMAGVSAKALLIKTSGSVVPTAVLAKVRGHALGSSADILEVGLRAESLQEAIMKVRAPNVRRAESKSIRQILNKIINWKDLPEEEPLASAYIKLLGQEMVFLQVRKDDLEQLGQTIIGPIGSQWKKYIEQLSNGVNFHPVKAIVAAEIRHVTPTTVGLPMELSIISSGLAGAKGNIEASFKPSIIKLSELLASRIQMKAQLKPSVSMRTVAFMGVNSPLIQSGLELHTNVRLTIPVDVTAKITLKEGNFKIDSAPPEQENRVLSMDSQVYAVSRNIENLPAEKMIPILPVTHESHITRQNFESTSTSARTAEEGISAHSSILRDQIPSSVEEQRSPISNRWAYRTCVQAAKLGFQACLNSKMENALSFKHCPLYQLIGEHVLNVSIAPVNSDAQIEKIRLEIQAGAKALSKMSRLTDKESRPVRIRDDIGQDGVNQILKRASQTKPNNNTWTIGSSSSSSSIRGSGRSFTSQSSSSSSGRSRSRRNRGNEGSQRQRVRGNRYSSSSRTSSSSSSGASNPSKRISRRTSSRERSSERERLNILNFEFKSAKTSRYTVRKQADRSSTSISRDTSKFITKSKHGSGSKQRHSSRGSSILGSSQQRYLIGDAGAPVFVAILQSKRTDDRLQGYQLTGYGKISSQMPRVHLRLVELDAKSNWRICADAAMSSSHQLLALTRWGENCEDHRISVKVSNGQLASHPALKVKIRWSRVPEYLKYNARFVRNYIPGLAYQLGFSQMYQRNPSHQITALVAVTTPRTIDTIVKLPKMTVYYQGLQVATGLPFHEVGAQLQERGFSCITDIPVLFLTMNQRECVAENEIVTSFDGVPLRYQLPNDCYHILTQDCSQTPKFMLLMRRAENDKTKKAIKLLLSLDNTSIEAIPTQNGIRLLVNGVERPLNQQIPSLGDIVTIRQNDTGIILEAPSINIDLLYFDGDRVQIVLDQMMSKTCGICGLNNGERKMMMPNQEEARNVEGLFQSWIHSGKSCKDDCKVGQQFVELEKVMEVDGVLSKCYSVEPVQRCLAQCSPIETVSLNVDFHCVPSNSIVSDLTMFNKKSMDISRSVDSHSDCLCRCTEA